MRQMKEKIKENGEGADILVDSAHVECSDSCKSCKHWNSPEMLSVVYSTHFSDELLTAAQTSALTDAAVALSYPCPSCESCNSCKDDSLELRSIAEEGKQVFIQKSVSFDPVKGKLTAMLPFIKDPSWNLHNNENVANEILSRNWTKLKKKESPS